MMSSLPEFSNSLHNSCSYNDKHEKIHEVCEDNDEDDLEIEELIRRNLLNYNTLMRKNINSDAGNRMFEQKPILESASEDDSDEEFYVHKSLVPLRKSKSAVTGFSDLSMAKIPSSTSSFWPYKGIEHFFHSPPITSSRDTRDSISVPDQENPKFKPMSEDTINFSKGDVITFRSSTPFLSEVKQTKDSKDDSAFKQILSARSSSNFSDDANERRATCWSAPVTYDSLSSSENDVYQQRFQSNFEADVNEVFMDDMHGFETNDSKYSPNMFVKPLKGRSWSFEEIKAKKGRKDIFGNDLDITKMYADEPENESLEGYISEEKEKIVCDDQIRDQDYVYEEDFLGRIDKELLNHKFVRISSKESVDEMSVSEDDISDSSMDGNESDFEINQTEKQINKPKSWKVYHVPSRSSTNWQINPPQQAFPSSKSDSFLWCHKTIPAHISKYQLDQLFKVNNALLPGNSSESEESNTGEFSSEMKPPLEDSPNPKSIKRPTSLYSIQQKAMFHEIEDLPMADESANFLPDLPLPFSSISSFQRNEMVNKLQQRNRSPPFAVAEQLSESEISDLEQKIAQNIGCNEIIVDNTHTSHQFYPAKDMFRLASSSWHSDFNMETRDLGVNTDNQLMYRSMHEPNGHQSKHVFKRKRRILPEVPSPQIQNALKCSDFLLSDTQKIEEESSYHLRNKWMETNTDIDRVQSGREDYQPSSMFVTGGKEDCPDQNLKIEASTSTPVLLSESTLNLPIVSTQYFAAQPKDARREYQLYTYGDLTQSTSATWTSDHLESPLFDNSYYEDEDGLNGNCIDAQNHSLVYKTLFEERNCKMVENVRNGDPKSNYNLAEEANSSGISSSSCCTTFSDLDGNSAKKDVNGESEKTPQFNTTDKLTPTHRAQFQFIPRHNDELRLEVGDALCVKECFVDNWCYGVNLRTRQQGIFPAAHICEIDLVGEICNKALSATNSQDPPNKHERDTFYLTMLASIEVAHHKGNDTLIQAINKVCGIYTQREEIVIPQTVLMEVSFRGIHVIDKRKKDFFRCPTFDYFFSLQNISFCGAHPKQLRYFGFITKHPLLPRFACHVFLSNESTQPIVEAIGRAFKRGYDQYMAFAHPTFDIFME